MAEDRKSRSKTVPASTTAAAETAGSTNETSGPNNSGLPMIGYVKNSDRVNTLVDKTLKFISDTRRFFNYGGMPVYVVPGQGMRLITPSNFNACLVDHIDFAISKKTEDGDELQYYSLFPTDKVGAFVQSPGIVSKWPRLTCYTRVPVFTADWRMVAQPGFDEASGIYYDGETVVPSTSKAALESVLREFCWQSQDADRTNYLGALITGVTMPMWIGRHPFVLFNGNKPGVGKSLLAEIVAIILDGRLSRTITFNTNDEEFEKQIATRARSGEKVIIVDNAKPKRGMQAVASACLERCLTALMLNFRRLGANAEITRPNDVLFCLTMNHARLSADLHRRSLPVNLEYTGDIRLRNFDERDMPAFVLESRAALIAEILGIVQRWLDAGKQLAATPAQHSTSQEWARTIDSILRKDGFNGFLTNFDRSTHESDPDQQLMQRLCNEFHAHEPATASEWATFAKDLLQHRIPEVIDPSKSRSAETQVGTLFTHFVHDTYVHESIRYKFDCQITGGNHPKKYYFAPLPLPTNSENTAGESASNSDVST